MEATTARAWCAEQAMRRVTSSYFNHYYALFRPFLKRILRKMRDRGRDLGDDSWLASEADRAFMYAMIHYDPHNGAGAKFFTYAFERIYLHLCNHEKYMRRQVRHAAYLSQDEMADRMRAVKPDLDTPILVADVLACLTPPERTVVLGMLKDGLPSRQIAPKIGKSHDTVCRMLDTALSKIRERFSQEEIFA